MGQPGTRGGGDAKGGDKKKVEDAVTDAGKALDALQKAVEIAYSVHATVKKDPNEKQLKKLSEALHKLYGASKQIGDVHKKVEAHTK